MRGVAAVLSCSEQSQILDEPTAEVEYFGQIKHVVTDVAPRVVEYFPAGQRLHDAA